MAFVDFNPTRFDAFAGAVAAAEPVFSETEWTVIALARKDDLRSLRPASRLDRWLGWLFGTRPNPHLADGRLEALRRMAVLAWRRGWSLPPSEFEAFERAQFSPHHLETLFAAIRGNLLPADRRAAL
jgi:hypothetical protein